MIATRADRPEVCCSAQGSQILSNREVKLWVIGEVLRARPLMSRRTGWYELIAYWAVMGETVATSRTDRALAQLSYGACGIIPDGMLVPASNIDSNRVRGLAVQADFIVDMSHSLSPSTPSVVVGSVS